MKVDGCDSSLGKVKIHQLSLDGDSTALDFGFDAAGITPTIRVYVVGFLYSVSPVHGERLVFRGCVGIEGHGSSYWF